MDIFPDFMKWRGGNKTTYWENRNNPKGSRTVDHHYHDGDDELVIPPDGAK